MILLVSVNTMSLITCILFYFKDLIFIKKKLFKLYSKNCLDFIHETWITTLFIYLSLDHLIYILIRNLFYFTIYLFNLYMFQYIQYKPAKIETVLSVILVMK